MMITLRNDFHDTSVRIRAQVGDELTSAQVNRARRVLCGITTCVCGGNLGERGPQEIEVDPIGYDRDGKLRIRILSREP